MLATYLDHSGFFIEGEEHCLLFDYYRGKLPQIPAGKKLLVFASHHHPDHYSAEIFRYGELVADTRYLLGCDITLNSTNREKMGITDDIFLRCDRMHKDDILIRNGVTIRTLRSSDMGVAFCVECEGKRIYHAGDHNLWIWRQDTSFDRSQIAKFYEELEKIRGLNFDAAFLPLDPRLGDEYWRGFDAFARLVESKKLIPMHMVDDPDIIRRMKDRECSRIYKDKIIEIKAPEDRFKI